MEHELIHERDMFLQSDIMRQPMLPAIRTLVDRIPHGTGIDRGRQQRIDRQRRHPACAETWESLPGPTAVTGLVDRIVRGDVENIGIRRMERDRDNRLALLLAAETGDQEGAIKAKYTGRVRSSIMVVRDLIIGVGRESI